MIPKDDPQRECSVNDLLENLVSRIASIQILRGLAATMVAAYHLRGAALSEGFDPGVFDYFVGGEIGVHVFFVISGFIIYFVSVQRSSMTWLSFIVARFWRIFPTYWAILSLYILGLVALTCLQIQVKISAPVSGVDFLSFAPISRFRNHHRLDPFD